MASSKKDDLIKDPEEALAFTRRVIEETLSDEPVWVIPQSGGKDSRATAQAVLVLIERGDIRPPKRLIFPMSDTLLEFPSFIGQARESLTALVEKAESLGVQAEEIVVQPIVQDDFWVRIIGKGFAPPTQRYRWCTDKLKIAPMRRQLGKRGVKDAPTLLGVRYGESKRRDKYLSCTLGGECGPEAMARKLKNTVEPIVHWRQCAVWDFLTLIAPEYGFDNSALVTAYGPDGDMRYGCWPCPLIYNDRTAAYLAPRNPILHALITWTNRHFRRGGEAFKSQNRELYRTGKDNALVGGRLSLDYCRRLYEDLIYIGGAYGVELLNDWQKAAIKAEWRWRESAPPAQLPAGGQPPLLLVAASDSRPPVRPLHITQIKQKTASTLANVALVDDPYHRDIQEAARNLLRFHGGYQWKYLGSTTSAVLWESLGQAARRVARYDMVDGNISVSF